MPLRRRSTAEPASPPPLFGAVEILGPTPTPADPARRLAETKAELEALCAPPLPAPAGADVDALTAEYTRRSGRVRALQAIIPSLERDVLVSRISAMTERFDSELDRANELLAELDRAAAEAQRADQEYRQIRPVALQASNRAAAIGNERRNAEQALAEFDARYPNVNGTEVPS